MKPENEEPLYQFLLLYYLEDLWNPPIYDEIMESPNQDELIRKYITAWANSDERLKTIII